MNSVSPLKPKRTHVEMLAEILEFCRKSRVKTQIMHKANMSYSAMQESVKQLLKLELLKLNHDDEKYQTTERGLEFLRRHSNLLELLKS